MAIQMTLNERKQTQLSFQEGGPGVKVPFVAGGQLPSVDMPAERSRSDMNIFNEIDKL